MFSQKRYLKMRRLLVIAPALMVLGFPHASAFETFIPMGTGYSTEISEVPAFDSSRGRVNQEADIIETEIYRRQREAQMRDSRMSRFKSDPEVSGGDDSIDY
jgi:hypothetical protein